MSRICALVLVCELRELALHRRLPEQAAPNELALYERIWLVLGARVVKPDLVVYLQARPEVLASRVRKRGRDFERGVGIDYLETVSRAYGDFFFHYEETPLLVVNTSDIDLVGSARDVEALAAVIRRHRKGGQHYLPAGSGT